MDIFGLGWVVEIRMLGSRFITIAWLRLRAVPRSCPYLPNIGARSG